MLIKLGAQLVVDAADVIEKCLRQCAPHWVKAERPEAEQRNLLAFGALGASERKLYDVLVDGETRHTDELAENSGLNSSEVLATLCDLRMKGVVPQLPGNNSVKLCCSWI
jgi:predicted Rossmann fold nucleotide-binding protein DprA/Smf involved in DNA uptake